MNSSPIAFSASTKTLVLLNASGVHTFSLDGQEVIISLSGGQLAGVAQPLSSSGTDCYTLSDKGGIVYEDAQESIIVVDSLPSMAPGEWKSQRRYDMNSTSVKIAL
ncbi:MAG: hypothetical protein D6765_07585, partial [Bacteroidetes bacterium]